LVSALRGRTTDQYIDQAWQSSLGGTAATKVTGDLSNYSLANVARNNDSCHAGVYILVSTACT
jgi:hypothetical protein